jgi:hypothetical protein
MHRHNAALFKPYHKANDIEIRHLWKIFFPSWLHRRESAVEFSPELQISAQIVAANNVRQSTVQVDPRSLHLAGTAVAQPIVVR